MPHLSIFDHEIPLEQLRDGAPELNLLKMQLEQKKNLERVNVDSQGNRPLFMCCKGSTGHLSFNPSSLQSEAVLELRIRLFKRLESKRMEETETSKEHKEPSKKPKSTKKSAKRTAR